MAACESRFDRAVGLVPEQDRHAGRFVPGFHIARIENVPNFTDLSPRMGVAYDLFGNGKRAVKASVGRYLGQFGPADRVQQQPRKRAGH